jgi:hypothetical protein
MNFDDDFPLAVSRDLERLDMSIEDCLIDVSNSCASRRVRGRATLHSICPNYVGVHGRENAFDVCGH